MKNLFFLFLLVLPVKIVLADCDDPDFLLVDSPESVEAVNPASIKASMYDPILDNANIEAYYAFSKNSGNLGRGAFDYELLIFDKVKNGNVELCAHIAHGSLYETRKVAYTLPGINSNVKAENFFEICPEKEISKRYPYYDHVCNFFIRPDEAYVFDESSKNKGTRGGHGNTFVYSTAKIEIDDNDTLECIGFGTAFNAVWSSYFKDVVFGSICTNQKNYFKKDTIKKIAQSVGIYGTAEPPKDLRLEFHK